MSFLPLFLFPLLYAETHYRFKYFFSFLKKSEPEILADVPHRLDPGVSIPVLILVKDADRYPVVLNEIEIEISDRERRSSVRKRVASDLSVNGALWWKVIPFDIPEVLRLSYGYLDIDVSFVYSVGRKRRSCKNDNYRTSSKKNFSVFRSATPLPSVPGWFQGDAHTHSSYTHDQVEFGSPLEASVELCKAMGLSFFCVTDHSYDLDDRVDNYLVNDPALPKWGALQTEVDALNSTRNDFVIVRGEEVSCSNRAGANVHLLLWGTREFFPGSGDGAEKWFRTSVEHSIVDILARKGSRVTAYASHPTEPTPSLQRLFINRDVWSLADMSESGLDGLQILNGEADSAFKSGLESWSRLLLKGKRLFIAAGNDAHGNFNRFRQVGVPFLKIREKDVQLFGKMRTAVMSTSKDEASIVASLKNGHSAITNGPLAVFRVVNEKGDTANIGDRIQGSSLKVHVNGVSTPEFGGFREIRVLLGSTGSEKEMTVVEKSLTGDYKVDLAVELDTGKFQLPAYLRLEAETANPAGLTMDGFCYTNPIWIEQRESAGY